MLSFIFYNSFSNIDNKEEVNNRSLNQGLFILEENYSLKFKTNFVKLVDCLNENTALLKFDKKCK